MSDSPNERIGAFLQMFRSVLILFVVSSVCAAVILIFGFVFRP